IALFLRLWSAWSGTAACTWDDSTYRALAVESPLSLPQVVRSIILPTIDNHPKIKINTGYILWLVMGLRTFGWLGTPSGSWGCFASQTERAWQVVNIWLLLIQLCCVYGIARWGLGDRSLAMAIMTAYLVAPIVFGMNRWVMTENHVMAALWVAIAMALWAVVSQRKWAPILAAVAIGVFATTREYALPL